MSERHLKLLAELIPLLRRYSREVTREQIESNRETWLKVRGALEVAAQCCIDLALAMLSKRKLGPPQSYREAFALLASAGVIDDELARSLERWAGFRNVLVHLYTTLDLDVVCRALGETAPLEAFGRIAAAELASN